jgi:hypothetical protein
MHSFRYARIRRQGRNRRTSGRLSGCEVSLSTMPVQMTVVQRRAPSHTRATRPVETSPVSGLAAAAKAGDWNLLESARESNEWPR